MGSCQSVRTFLHRESSALDDADRLLLERHLSACERCAFDRANVLRLREAARDLPSAPSTERDLARLVASALLAGPTPDVMREPRRVRWPLVAVAVAAFVATAAAATAIGVAVIAPSEDATPADTTPPDEPAVREPESRREAGPAAPMPAAPPVHELDEVSLDLEPPAGRAPRTNRVPSRPTAASLLESARADVAAGRFGDGERHAGEALDARPSRAQAAEARAIQAECAQGLGRIDDAIARYRGVADRYDDLAVGETALFTAARLEARRDHAAAARALLVQYLDRYAAGRYASDARRLLAELGAP